MIKSVDFYPIVLNVGSGELIPTMLLGRFTGKVSGLFLAEICGIGFRLRMHSECFSISV